MLNDSTLKKIHRKPQPKQIVLTDRDGLYCRVSKKGTISFFMRYQYDGKSDAVTLGQYPVMSLREARDRNVELRAALMDGVNPKVKRRIEVKQNTNALTFSEMVDLWYEKEAKQTIKNHVHAYAQIQNHLIGEVGSLPAKDITTIMFFDLLDEIKKKAPTVILALIPNIKRCYSLAMRRRLVETNPLAGITAKRDFHVTGGVSDRVLNDDELIRLLTYFDSTHQRFYKKNTIMYLALLFGCRMSEIRLAEWKHFDFFNMVWTVPPENHKTGRHTKLPLLRPIIPEVKESIEFLMGVSNSNQYLVSKKDGSLRDVQFWQHWPKQINHWLVKNGLEPIDHWSVHDLRRTMRTNISKFAPPHIGEIMIGHSLKGTWGIYDRESYLDEQREAYTKWFEKLDTLRKGEQNIVELNAINTQR